MRVLFAVNNDNISDAIVKKYQKEYKEIISHKNVYYFNAILKELQNDKSYDRIVISEDLEPFANNNYDTIDKFLFEKLDKISDEATNVNGDNIEVIVICTDRRNKSDEMLVKFFSIGIYNAIIGQDRSIDEVCKLINMPRTKKDAKIYYKIETNSVEYQAENENNVSEAEVQNILAHYKRLGKNEDKYVDSFNNIASQYTDAQLKIIIRYLPINVKAVLEEKSPKYQQLSTFSVKNKDNKEEYRPKSLKNIQQEEPINVKMLNSESSKSRITKPIVIPSVLTGAKTKIARGKKEMEEPLEDLVQEEPNVVEDVAKNIVENEKVVKDERDFDLSEIEKLTRELDETLEEDEDIVEETNQEESIQEVAQEEPAAIQSKRGRGRPRKIVPPEEANKPKRGRGRPRKIVKLAEEEQQESIEEEQREDDEDLMELFNINNDIKIPDIKPPQNIGVKANISEENEEDDDLDLFNFDDLIEADKEDVNDDSKENQNEEDVDLFNIDDDENDDDLNLFDMKEESKTVKNAENTKDVEDDIDLFDIGGNDDIDLFNMDNEEDKTSIKMPQYDFSPKTQNSNEEDVILTNQKSLNNSINRVISRDKKIVAFVGTTKNGTSFVVNNLAELLSEMNISTAILDVTKSRNAYYIYTNNDETLREIATNSINKLKQGTADGIKVNKNLSVYTSLPGEEDGYNNVEKMLETLADNYDIVLIDTDFETPLEFFSMSQEIYIIQSMDVLTIQPLTAFLRTLKAKNILRQENIRIVINKEQKLRNLSTKLLVGGISSYNDPAMSFMTELFDKDNVQVCKIPFEVQNYDAYLEALVNCKISLNGYTKQFIKALTELAGIVYPLMDKKTYNPMGNGKNAKQTPFSDKINSTLNKMKNNY